MNQILKNLTINLKLCPNIGNIEVRKCVKTGLKYSRLSIQQIGSLSRENQRDYLSNLFHFNSLGVVFDAEKKLRFWIFILCQFKLID